MSRPSNRKPARPATEPIAGLNHTVLAGGDGTIDADAETPTPGNRMMILEVLSGGRRGLIKRCNKDKFRLGRRSHNDLSFDGKEDRAVSGNHLLLERRADAWWAQDLKSTNGTLLNGKSLTAPAPLTSEDILELGRRPEMGTGGTVKLRLRFEAVGEGVEEETQDEATRLRPGDEAGSASGTGAGSATISATSTAVPPSEHEALTIDKTAKIPTTGGSAGAPEGASPTPEPQTSPAPEPQATPASTGKLLADLQDKTLQLGKVSYRLEDLLAGICRAALGDSSIEIAGLAGGPDLLAGIESRAKLLADRDHAEAELSGHGPFAEAKLKPLEAAAKSSAEALAKARQESEKAGEVAASTASALAKLDEDARSSLKGLLSGVTEGLGAPAPPGSESPTSADRAADSPAPKAESSEAGPPWTEWVDALDQASADLQERRPALDEATKSAADARLALESAQAAAEQLALDHAEASDALDQQTAAMAARLSEWEGEVARLNAECEPAEDQERESMADFAEANLEAEGQPFASLPGHAKAVSLSEQRRALETEVETLRKQLGA